MKPIVVKKMSYEKKVEIARKIQQGNMTERRLAEIYDTSKGTIHRIRKDILLYLDPLHNQPKSQIKSDREIDRTVASKWKELDRIVFEVFSRMRMCSISINGPVIKAIALKVAEKSGLNDFKASSGWLERFKVRHGLEFKAISGESKSADHTKIQDFLNTLEQKMTNYNPENIWNCDETALFYRKQPCKSFVVESDDCKGLKQKKERLTILLCCSMKGEKYNPLIIGKSRSPRCLNNFNPDTVGVDYTHSKNAWMTSMLFKLWCQNLNDKMVKKGRNILLVLDNVGSHKGFPLSNIEFLFLPKNTTSILQPLDNGIIKSFKNHYNNSMIDSFVFSDFTKDIDPFTTLDIKSAIIFSSIAWGKVTVETVTNCFDQAFFSIKVMDLNSESDLIVSEEVMEEVVEIVLDEDEEILFEDEDNSENDQVVVSSSREDAINAMKKIEALKNDVELLNPHLLKPFYEFRIDFVKGLKKKYDLGSKITDFFNKD